MIFVTLFTNNKIDMKNTINLNPKILECIKIVKINLMSCNKLLFLRTKYESPI